MLKPCNPILAVVAWTGIAVGASAAPPNIVFLLADDLGWRDLGCYGSRFYETPNIDALAASGARFTQAYAACPVCSPTRASILTGKYPQRIQVTDYISPSGSNQPEKWNRNTQMLPAPYSDRMPLGEVTLAEALREGGYSTFFAGKWHLGPEGFWPEDQGFDINEGGGSTEAPGAATTTSRRTRIRACRTARRASTFPCASRGRPPPSFPSIATNRSLPICPSTRSIPR